jgi:F-type H+-transporting ATPase subunit b
MIEHALLATIQAVAPAAAEAGEHAAGNPFLTDPKYFVLYGMLLFFGLVYAAKAHHVVLKALDDRGAAIAKELVDAEKLRLDAQALLESYKSRHAAAEKEAAEIVAQARADAVALRADAEKALAADLARREKQAEERIARAEAQARAEVKSAAADAAIAAAERLLKADLADPARQGALIQTGVQDLARKIA